VIAELVTVFTFFIAALMVAYTVRHYVFTLYVLKETKKPVSIKQAKTDYKPTVSILIPARNEGQVIERLLQRITELTYPTAKMQVVVIDDASTDETGKIADNYSQTIPFQKVITQQPKWRKRQSIRHERRFQTANSEIVLCFDADYYPQKDIIERLTSAFSDPQVGAVQGRVLF
jgi:cellulose synthase/poly-beta-1,6-N-acetylglucosamine synthase-like glycosyltransferase